MQFENFNPFTVNQRKTLFMQQKELNKIMFRITDDLEEESGEWSRRKAFRVFKLVWIYFWLIANQQLLGDIYWI